MARAGSGLDNIDISYAKWKDIKVVNPPFDNLLNYGLYIKIDINISLTL